MSDSFKRLLFFDKTSAIDGYLNRSRARDGDLIIAMNPNVFVRAKDMKLNVRNTLAYFDNSSHERMLLESKEMVEWLGSKIQFVDPYLGVKDAYKDICIFYIRFNIHYLVWLIEIITNAVEMHRPETVSSNGSKTMYEKSPFAEVEENRLGYLVRKIARINGMVYEDILNKEKTGFGNDLKSFTEFLLKHVRFAFWQRIMAIKKSFGSRKAVLYTSGRYQMHRLIKVLESQIPDTEFYLLPSAVIANCRIPNWIIRLFWRLSSKEMISQESLFNDMKCEIEKASAIFSHKGASFAEILSEKMEKVITWHIISLMLWTDTLNKTLKSLAPYMVMMNGTRDDDAVLSELCGRSNIPAFLVSHGSHVRPKNEYEHIEWGEHGRILLRAPFSYVAFQTPLSEGYSNEFGLKGRVIKTGPLIWGLPVDRSKSEKLFKDIFGDKFEYGKVRVILHASTPKCSTSLRPFVYETSDEYVQALRDLVEAIKSVNDALLIIRFRPSPEISPDTIKSLIRFADNVILSTDGPFIDLLGLSDLVVSYSSTTIEEALQNNIPVLLYGGSGRYAHIPAYEIADNNTVSAKPIYHVSHARDLAYAIDKILSFKICKQNNPKELFESYVYSQEERVPFTEIIKMERD